MEKVVQLFKALGDNNRFRIIKMLQHKSLCVCEITAVLGLATPTVSRHLRILREADIITDFKNGRWVEYHLNPNSKSLFVNGLLKLVMVWLNDEGQMKTDIEKLSTTDRLKLCKVQSSEL